MVDRDVHVFNSDRPDSLAERVPDMSSRRIYSYVSSFAIAAGFGITLYTVLGAEIPHLIVA
jgi:hypothetical protein